MFIGIGSIFPFLRFIQSFDQLQLSMSLMVSGVRLGKLMSIVRKCSSWVKVLANIFIFLHRFAARIVAGNLFSAAYVTRRGGCIATFSYCGVVTTVVRNIFILKDMWCVSQEK